MQSTDIHLTNLIDLGILYAGLPPLMTNRAIAQAANDALREFERHSREKIIDSIQTDENILIDARENILACTPCADRFPVTIERADGQTEASHEEQSLAFNMCQAAVDDYCNPRCVFEQSILLTGPPGAGKTYLFQKVLLYCLLRGLRVAVTATMSERARGLGGEHLHWLFGIPVTTAPHETPPTLALKTINALATRPQRAAFLKRLDILFFDEIGQLSGEMLTVMDYVLRSIRGVDQPMGGVLIFSTG